VFPQSELGTFLALQKKDKERQLHELAMIVTGIRLFNKDCGKGGDGIEDCKLQKIYLLNRFCALMAIFFACLLMCFTVFDRLKSSDMTVFDW